MNTVISTLSPIKKIKYQQSMAELSQTFSIKDWTVNTLVFLSHSLWGHYSTLLDLAPVVCGLPIPRM